MEKNQLKWYESPAVEVVEMEVAQFLCASGDVEDPWNPGNGGSVGDF